MFRIFTWWVFIYDQNLFFTESFLKQNFSTISHRTHRIVFVTALLISDGIYATIHCLENREPQIAVRSHIAGALSGILLGFIFYEAHRSENRDEDLKFKILKWASLGGYLSFVTIVILVNIIWISYRKMIMKSNKLTKINDFVK